MKHLLNWGVFVLVLLGVYVLAGPTSMGGPASYVIVDGTSMEPTYMDGDLVIAYGEDTYETGDVIVYDAPIDSQFDVIHRIVGPTDGGFVTQGDNRDEVDGWIAPHETIYGAARVHLPNGGLLVRWLRQPTIIFGLAMGLLAFEVVKRSEDIEEAAGAAEDAAEADPDVSPEEPESVRALLQYARDAAASEAAEERPAGGSREAVG